MGLDMPPRLAWHEKGHVPSYVADGSLFLLRPAIKSREKLALSCSQSRSMCNASPTSSDWSERRWSILAAIHILVNNAGSVPSMQFTEVDDAHWHDMLEGKLLSYIRVTCEVVPHMRKAAWGRIINIAGGGGRQPTATGMAVGKIGRAHV